MTLYAVELLVSVSPDGPDDDLDQFTDDLYTSMLESGHHARLSGSADEGRFKILVDAEATDPFRAEVWASDVVRNAARAVGGSTEEWYDADDWPVGMKTDLVSVQQQSTANEPKLPLA